MQKRWRNKLKKLKRKLNLVESGQVNHKNSFLIKFRKSFNFLKSYELKHDELKLKREFNMKLSKTKNQQIYHGNLLKAQYFPGIKLKFEDTQQQRSKKSIFNWFKMKKVSIFKFEKTRPIQWKSKIYLINSRMKMKNDNNNSRSKTKGIKRKRWESRSKSN